MTVIEKKKVFEYKDKEEGKVLTKTKKKPKPTLKLPNASKVPNPQLNTVATIQKTTPKAIAVPSTSKVTN